MQVYLPAIAGHIPPHMVHTISAFLDFCYLMRRLTLDNQMLDTINNALTQFHKNHVIFEECGVCPIGFSLPHQHSMVYYHCLIQAFGAPNGLCSSIAESKHIKAVKEPWHCSSHFEALRQMLVINQRIDKLLTIHVDYNMWHMLNGPLLKPMIQQHQLLVPILPIIPIPIIPIIEDGEVEGPHIMATVTLSKTLGKVGSFITLALLTIKSY